jgi:hypothetical protein
MKCPLLVKYTFKVLMPSVIFSEILKDFYLNFKAVIHHSMDDLLEPLIQHEKLAMQQLISNGLYY